MNEWAQSVSGMKWKEKTCKGATWSTINFASTGLLSKPSLRGDTPANNQLFPWPEETQKNQKKKKPRRSADIRPRFEPRISRLRSRRGTHWQWWAVRSWGSAAPSGGVQWRLILGQLQVGWLNSRVTVSQSVGRHTKVLHKNTLKKTGNVLWRNNEARSCKPLLQCKRNMYCLFWVCVCRLRYPAYDAHAPYCHLWPAPLCNIFLHYLINGKILGRKKDTQGD